MVDISKLKDFSNTLRRDSLIMTSKAGSGHPSSCLSSADLISYLFFSEMRYDPSNPNNPDNDEFILSKGHAAPLLYSALFHSGCISQDLEKLRKLESPLEGHPVPSSMGWIRYATGSLGQGLSIGIGIAQAFKLQKRKSKVYVLLGDSELAEGSNYEAMQFASYYNINNLYAIIDVNRLGQRGETMLAYDLRAYQQRLESFGWQTIVIDGHNMKQIADAFEKSRKSDKPVAIIAKTIKGKGVSFMENKEGWHGKALNELELKKALKEIPESENLEFIPNIPEQNKIQVQKTRKHSKENVESFKGLSTREAYGLALSNIALSDDKIIAIDAEVSNSTFSNKVKERTPEQFIECFIAEQNMIGISLGLSIKGFNVFSSTFSAFLTRAHDQIRMASISNASFTVCGSHCGVSIGEDGPSQMGLEDIALFRSIPNSTILYPSDSISAEKLTHLSSELRGIRYIRTTRPKTPDIYDQYEQFLPGDFKILRETIKIEKKNKKSKSKNKVIQESDSVVLIGSGITVHESLRAHDILKRKGINSAVIDLYSIKPLNKKKLIEFIKSHGSKIVISEDHYREGGIGEMLSSLLINSGIKIRHLAVDRVPHSGAKDQLLEKYRINFNAIVDEAVSLAKD